MFTYGLGYELNIRESNEECGFVCEDFCYKPSFSRTPEMLRFDQHAFQFRFLKRFKYLLSTFSFSAIEMFGFDCHTYRLRGFGRIKGKSERVITRG